MKRGALRSALSAKVADGGMIGIDALTVSTDLPSTKAIVSILNTLPLMREVRTKHYDKDETVEGTKQVSHKILLIVAEHDPKLLKSIRNVPYITLRHGSNFSVRDLLAAGRVVLAQEAVAGIVQALNGGAKVEEAAE
jgi:ribosomal protein L4